MLWQHYHIILKTTATATAYEIQKQEINLIIILVMTRILTRQVYPKQEQRIMWKKWPQQQQLQTFQFLILTQNFSKTKKFQFRCQSFVL